MSLLQMSLSGGVMVLAVVLLRALAVHRLPKRLFLALWGMVCLRLLLPYSLPSSLSVFNYVPVALPATGGSVGYVAGVPAAPVPETAGPAAAGPAAGLQVWPLVWLCGAVLLALGFLALYLRGRRRFAQSLPVANGCVVGWQAAHSSRRPLQVRQSDQITAPLTYGVLRPVILLPKAMAATAGEGLALVLAHEWVHVRRFDAAKKLVLAAVLCVHWFNPLVWVLYILANRDIELACDEAVMRHLGAGQKAGYALALLHLAEKSTVATPFASGFSKYAIEERIHSIMKYKKATVAAAVASFALMGAMLCGFATTPAQAATPGTAAEARAATAAELGEYEQAVKDWATFGVTYNEAEGRVYYQGELVRFFYDNRATGLFSGLSGTVHDMEDGVHYLQTTRDNNGNLTGIENITPDEAAKLAHWR